MPAMLIRLFSVSLCVISLLFTGCKIEESPSESVLILDAGDADGSLDTCVVSDLPYYGSASFPNASLSLEYKLGGTGSDEFELIIPENEYGFFMYPAALGEATFYGGAWGGAAWEPDDLNSTATRNEPVVILKDDTQWFVYRTDYTGGGRLLSHVEFSNPGLSVGESATCHVDGLKHGDVGTFNFDLGNAKRYTHPIVEPLPAPSAENNNEICRMNALPVYGAVDLTLSSRQLLSQSLSDSHGDDFNLTLSEKEYGFFAYPAALGKATFFDRDFFNARGGWHGATWTPYNSTFEEYSVTEPIVAEVGGTNWYIYRTDNPGLGDTTYAVRFENPGLMIGAEVACDISDMSFVDYQNLKIEVQDEELLPTPPESNEDLEGVCTFTEMPRVGGSSEPIGLAGEVLALDKSLTSILDTSFTFNLTANEYGFFAYPAALGEAIFRDKANGFQVGLDGATWDYSRMRMYSYYEFRPLVASVDGSKWFILRTDALGSSGTEFSVEFENKDLSLGDKAACDLKGFAQVSTGSVIGDDLTATRIFVSGNTDTQLAEGIVIDGVWTINTSYFDLRDVIDPDLNRFNTEGVYDMFFYSSDGTVHGPAPVTVEDGEIINKIFDTSQM